jgi:hypothetical protein
MTRAIIVLLLLIWPAPAGAHTRSQTNATLTVGDQGVRLSLAIEAREVTRIAGAAGPGAGLEQDMRLHFLKAITLSADGAPCQATATAPAFASTMRMEIAYACPKDWRALSLTYGAFFDVARGHIAIVHADVDGQPRGETVLSKLSRDLTLPRAPGAPPSRPAGFWAFLTMGIAHILEGLDHLCFVAGLLLLARSFGAAVLTLTGFTLGHSATLALGALDLVRVSPAAVETLIAATIFCVGLEALRARGGGGEAVRWAMAAALGFIVTSVAVGGAPVWLCLAAIALVLGAGFHDAQATDWRRPFAFAAGFGTIHGLAFAETLREVLTPGGGLLVALLGFNLGVELGQIFAAAVAAGLLAIWRVRHAPSAETGAFVASCLLLFGGAVWLAARLPLA